MKSKFVYSSIAIASLLAACGGGSNDGGTATPAATTPATQSPGAAAGDFTAGIEAVNNPVPTSEIQPAPASIGSDVPTTYFGPSPSLVQKELIGPFQLLISGTVDQDAGTITMPLYKGQMASGESVWYILTDTTDERNAAALGLNFSAKLNYAEVGRGVRQASQQLIGGKTTVVFQKGRVDFSPVLSVTPGAEPNPFPPTAVQPGAVGDADYSPLMKLGAYIYNAPMMAFNVPDATLNAFCDGNADKSLVHDKVVKICPRTMTVTIRLTQGFSFGRPVLYLSTEANAALPAALEGATQAPGLSDVPVGGDDGAFSAVERLFMVVNGPANDVAGERNPPAPGHLQRASRPGRPAQRAGRHPDGRHRLQPAVGRQPR